MKTKSVNDVKQENIAPTEIAIPKEVLPLFYEALKEYCNLEDHEFVEPPKREGTQNFTDNSGSIDEWYVDLKDFKCDGRNLNFDDLVWIGKFWDCHERSARKKRN